LGNLTPEQQQALQEMKKNFPDDHDDAKLLRFLRARDFNVSKAIDMLQKAIIWRKEYGAEDIKLENVRHIIERGEVCPNGIDKFGRPLIFANMKYHDPKLGPLLLQYQVYYIENLTKQMGDSLDTFTSIFNLEGFSNKNIDFNHTFNMINVFQNYYPERLGICFVINAPWFFGTIWKIVKPWLDKITASKIFFLDADYKERFKELIDEQFIPPEHGGKSTFDLRKKLAEDLGVPIDQIKTIEEANKIDTNRTSIWSRTKDYIWGPKIDVIPDARTLKIDENENKDKLFVDNDEDVDEEEESVEEPPTSSKGKSPVNAANKKKQLK